MTTIRVQFTHFLSFLIYALPKIRFWSDFLIFKKGSNFLLFGSKLVFKVVELLILTFLLTPFSVVLKWRYSLLALDSHE